MRTLFAALLCAAVLAACGEKPPAASGNSSTTAAMRSGNATAEEVAEAAREDIDCPAEIDTPPRAKGQPVDDVVGVRPGMTYEEAANVVLCTHELLVVQPDTRRGFRIETYGQTLRQGFSAQFAQPRIQKSSKQIMQEMQDSMMARSTNRAVQDMQPGQSKWYIGTMGMPGQERVINVAREEWFEAGRNPLVSSVEQALLQKYGTPTRLRHSEKTLNMTWAYDPMGRLVTETSPLFHQCNGTPDPDGGVNLSPDCGMVVAAAIFTLPENRALSRFLQVGVVDQAGGYERISAVQQGLQQMDAQRRAAELHEAAKNADAPSL